MKRFNCPNCANELFFDSTSCVKCGQRVGYVPPAVAMTTVAQDGDGVWRGAHAGKAYVLCANAAFDACNWLVEDAPGHGAYCNSCRHNRTIPNLSVSQNGANWRAIELAKRRTFYSLLRWRLPMPTRTEDANAGLEFDILESAPLADGTIERVLTGHDNGLITINLAEADDAVREQTRAQMKEPYRTLLGHFRHEIGHYYWDRLVRDRGDIAEFRAQFGDESADYGKALQRHYEHGPQPNWQSGYISSYASVHPWEDFAETWAHYIHIVDTLETARAYGLSVKPSIGDTAGTEVDFNPYVSASIEDIVDVWVPVTLALNSINRSMGQPDLYPFIISTPVLSKLGYIQKLVRG